METCVEGGSLRSFLKKETTRKCFRRVGSRMGSKSAIGHRQHQVSQSGGGARCQRESTLIVPQVTILGDGLFNSI